MGQKDLVSKQLENYPDVFADIVNALVYDGKGVVLETELVSAPTETLYKGGSGEFATSLGKEKVETTSEFTRNI